MHHSIIVWDWEFMNDFTILLRGISHWPPPNPYILFLIPVFLLLIVGGLLLYFHFESKRNDRRNI